MSAEGTGKIHKQIIEVMKNLDSVGKDKHNRDQGFQYRSIDQMYNVMHKILAECGVFTVPRVLSRERTDHRTAGGKLWNHIVLSTEFDFFADDGSKVTVGPIWSEGLDSGDKGSMKALAHAHKYALIQVFAIPTEDEKDPDAETVPPKQISKQPTKPRETPHVDTSAALTMLAQPTAGIVAQTWTSGDKSTTIIKTVPSQERPSDAQLTRLFTIATNSGWTYDKVKEYLSEKFKIESTKELTRAQYDDVVTTMQTKQFADAMRGLVK